MATGTIPALQKKPVLLFDADVSTTGTHSITTAGYDVFLLKAEGNAANTRTLWAPVGQEIEINIDATASIYGHIKLSIGSGTLNISSLSLGVWGFMGIRLWGFVL